MCCIQVMRNASNTHVRYVIQSLSHSLTHPYMLTLEQARKLWTKVDLDKPASGAVPKAVQTPSTKIPPGKQGFAVDLTKFGTTPPAPGLKFGLIGSEPTIINELTNEEIKLTRDQIMVIFDQMVGKPVQLTKIETLSEYDNAT